MNANLSPTARKPRWVVPVVIIVAAFFVGMFVASRIYSAVSSPSQTISWKPAVGIGGPAFDRAAARTTTVVNVEVQWPSCVELRDRSWLSADVSYVPWAVTITLRTTDSYAEQCPKHPDGRPQVGYYLSALSFPVQLSEPLGDRPLFDGSTDPATERYRP